MRASLILPAVPPVGSGQRRTGRPRCRAPPGDGRDRSAAGSGTQPPRDLLPLRLLHPGPETDLRGGMLWVTLPWTQSGQGHGGQGRAASQPFPQPRPARSRFPSAPAPPGDALPSGPSRAAGRLRQHQGQRRQPPLPARPRRSFVRTPRNKGAAAAGHPRPLPSPHPLLTAPPQPRCQRLTQRSRVSAAPARMHCSHERCNAAAATPLCPPATASLPRALGIAHRSGPAHTQPSRSAPLFPCRAHTARCSRRPSERKRRPQRCPARSSAAPGPAFLVLRAESRGPPAGTSRCRRGDAQRTILAVINSRKNVFISH